MSEKTGKRWRTPGRLSHENERRIPCTAFVLVQQAGRRPAHQGADLRARGDLPSFRLTQEEK